MPKLGLQLPGRLHGVDLDGTLTAAEAAERHGWDAVWKSETYWDDAVSVLSIVADRTERIKLGTAIVNVYSRTPALLAMGAKTVHDASGGRARLGLGASSPAIVEEWHGRRFDRPLRQIRETIEILRAILYSEVVEYHGDRYDVSFRAGYDLPQGSIPVFNAAIGEGNRRLTAEFADGWLPAFVPLSALPERIAQLEEWAVSADRDPDSIEVTPTVMVAVDETAAEARRRVRAGLVQEMAMGYDEVVADYGYGDAASRAARHWHEGNRTDATAAIPSEMIDDLTIYGTPAECRDRIASYGEAGADSLLLLPAFESSLSDVLVAVESLGTGI